MGKFEKFLYSFIKNDGLSFVSSLIVVVLLSVYFGSMANIIDYPVFSSVIITLVFNRVVDLVKNIIMQKLEDKVKLTSDYESLNNKYKNTKKLLTYDNTGTTDEDTIVTQYGKKEFTFPVCCDYMIVDEGFEIIDSAEVMYKAPEYVLQNFDKLMEAHKMSTIYNNLNIRVDDWFMRGDKFVLVTSRTTYFDSMSTNRVMDYKLENGISIRNMYEFGPVISTLKNSKLSNHLGFNAFVESDDGEIVFVKRSMGVSTGKMTYGNSIGASLKTCYALNEEGVFDVQSLERGILKEVEDELSLSSEYIENYHIIAAYRDLLEGGKPQLLVFVKSNLKKEDIMKKFNVNKRAKAKRMKSDGTKTFWIKKKEVMNLSIVPGGMLFKGNFFPMLPSASASVVMLIKYLNQKNYGDAIC